MALPLEENSDMAFAEAQLGGLGALLASPSSRDALRSFQTRRLRALVRHAYERVPYYRGMFDRAGLNPHDIRTLEDLRHIPTSQRLDFADVAEDDLIARGTDPGSVVKYPTSGSTGVPMVVRCTRFESRLLQAFRMQVMMRMGLRVTDRRSFVIASNGSDRPGILEAFGLFRGKHTNALWPRERIVAGLREWKPDVIRGYPSVLSSVASQLSDDDRRQIQPRFITTDSENLTPHMRLQIEQGFGVPVFDIYDCFECNVIAWQCPTGRQFHAMDAAVIVEILHEVGRPVAHGESGEAVLTPLHSWAAPLIRYRIGDLVERGLDQCSCGAPSSCLERVQGRLHDRFVLADGRCIHPQIFATAIYPHLANLRRYQFVQEDIDRIVLKLQPVPTAPLIPDQVEQIKQSMRRDLGDAIQLEVELAENIPAEPNGKFRTFRCLVPSERGLLQARQTPLG
jgi:phenylacetate-CoA ligase